jgi:hypothetical protein
MARVAVVALALGLSLGGTARAEDIDEGIPFKSVALQGNPLGLIIGRYSADLEYLPVPHHALHFSPVGYFALPGVADEITGFGAEMGYRWYSGLYGPHGFFLGASFIALSLQYIHGALPGVPRQLRGRRRRRGVVHDGHHPADLPVPEPLLVRPPLRLGPATAASAVRRRGVLRRALTRMTRGVNRSRPPELC